MGAERYARYFSTPKRSEGDTREPGQTDRDRILYTSAFRRLAGITQVVAPAEGHVFHNRLTHTLEVAQIGRRLAEKLRKRYGQDRISEVGGIDPDVVEAAALAHDLGHPPFGHVAEQTLCSLLDDLKLNSGASKRFEDGFEGNAQSFRIITKLAVRYQRDPKKGKANIMGLNLTRATLNAVMKYPWVRHSSGDHQDKWGAYSSERRFLDWARKDYPSGDFNRSVEAQLMDWADDVAYAVHDVEDFYRAGLIPLERLIKNDSEQSAFLNETIKRLSRTRIITSEEEEKLSNAFSEIKLYIRATEPYHGTYKQRAALRSSTSFFIDRYINAIDLAESSKTDDFARIDPELKREVTILKQLTWHYVIENPALETQQYGIRRVIEKLFEAFMDAASSQSKWTMLPEGYREELYRIEEEGEDKEQERIRIVVDLIASMTEQQALKMYQRLIGVSLGSVLDPTAL